MLKLRTLLIVMSVLLFAGSFFFDAFYVDRENPGAWAMPWAIAMAGWITLFKGVFAWAANPLLVSSWIYTRLSRRTAALVTGVAASLLAASFLLVETIQTSARPDYSRVTGYGAAYWLWLASPIVLTLANILPMRHATTSPPAAGVTARGASLQ